MKNTKFNFDAPDCTCPYKDGIVARNMCGHVPPCPVYERWLKMIESEKPLSEIVADVQKTQCSHRFVFLRTAKWTDEHGGYNTHFNRVDTFYCEHCLEQKEVRKNEYARDTPSWYRGDA